MPGGKGTISKKENLSYNVTQTSDIAYIQHAILNFIVEAATANNSCLLCEHKQVSNAIISVTDERFKRDQCQSLWRHFWKLPLYLHITAIIRVKTAPNTSMASTKMSHKAGISTETRSIYKSNGRRLWRDVTGLQPDDIGYNFSRNPA